jgi:hypothetical protein
MLDDAVTHYHELLNNQELAESSLKLLDEGFERAKLIFGGRRLSPYLRPHFVTEDDFARVVRICETVWGAIEKVKDAAVADESLLDELGLTPIERELAKIDPGYRAVSPTARLDSFLTDEAYSFVELNGESPAGIAYADAAFEIFAQLPVMKRFAESYSVRRFNGRPLMLKVLVDCYEEFLGRKPDRAPHIGIIDLKGMPTQKEFELFREYFEAQVTRRSSPHQTNSSFPTSDCMFAISKSTLCTSVCSLTSTCRSWTSIPRCSMLTGRAPSAWSTAFAQR